MRRMNGGLFNHSVHLSRHPITETLTSENTTFWHFGEYRLEVKLEGDRSVSLGRLSYPLPFEYKCSTPSPTPDLGAAHAPDLYGLPFLRVERS